MPRLSVIIPVHDGTATLARCLEALRRSGFAEYECIVVDDGSTEDVRAVAERFAATVVGLPRRGGPARARNQGASRARGEALVFLDADVAVHPDTLERIDRHLRDEPSAAAVFGSYDDLPADPHFVSQYKNLLHHHVHQRSRTDAWTFWAGCGAIRRDVFLAAGGFDERYRRPCVEDIELGFRLRAAGRRIDLDPSIQATHLKRWTLGSLVRADLFDRAIPWLRLMLRHRSMPADLNVTANDRSSVATAWLAALAAAAGGMAGSLALALSSAAAGACVLALLNFEVYRFFARKRGLLFAARAFPLHALYFLYCGLAVPIALAAEARRLAPPGAAAVREEDA